ncbi:MAG: DUF1284 domain-containing protein [Clostridium sp.]|nr:DUF1284 domain-containing protein [Clostridium sp.]
MKLRVHHLFCSALFVGKGYSDKFCENMDSVVRKLWTESPHDNSAHNEKRQENTQIELITEPDCICAQCPNLTTDGCSLDANNVVSKDEKLAQRLDLKVNRSYPVDELLRHTAAHMTEEIFETSCHNCEWYQTGLCSYEKLIEKYKAYQ